jgi:hypothetical protein
MSLKTNAQESRTPHAPTKSAQTIIAYDSGTYEKFIEFFTVSGIP